ncbi:hypothetical protein CDL12_29362 [Handroanthus impetiginosus]|uniref:Uncharacterized protein n=1 Tax=Handroanthus impetiginosus TaxID=429701 RepID=A0A2G9FYL9_9LAMI|nr:hypothetical protein CDL12_29362 [Handroanthus impetiginosus]
MLNYKYCPIAEILPKKQLFRTSPPIASPPREGGGRGGELVSVCGEIAKATIEKENPGVRALLVPPAIPTRDFRCDQVFVYVNEKGIS